MSFETFHLPEPLQRAIHNMKYTQPTPIQEKAIPAILEGKDLIGIAQTGTGKTGAFGIPIVAGLLARPNSQCLILVPTRELAIQIENVLKELLFQVKQFKTTLIIGGLSMHAQTRSMPRAPRLVIATPGRLLDHMEQRTISLAGFDMVVLDEADRMLDIGFEPQLRRIFRNLPRKRQTLLFSATFPKAIERLTAQYLINPTRISIGAVSQPVKEISQSVVRTTSQDKNAVLMKELQERVGSVLIFARTKHRTDRLARLLNEKGFKADRIHGDRTQGQRSRAMDSFRDQRVRILVATDIASRGIDIPHISHVVNYDLPQVAEDYVHRIGRTARAGAKGDALCLLTPEDHGKWKEISRMIGAGA
jgi:ATP-dependent RNA helicase DeaD